nr:RNase H1/viroplasmin domain-containing protein [Sinobaca sp. H24]
MAKTKFYVVWKGRKPGIYNTWPECQKQVKGYPGARLSHFLQKQKLSRLLRGKRKKHRNQETVIILKKAYR